MKQTDIPIWEERYTLTIEEASKYFRIGAHFCLNLTSYRETGL
ncbi:hypothetical protein EfmJHP35_10710 [Enterococcus faecium]|nr:hypothetical protein EfmJHP35_10710 [Enterococcus faecium]